MKPSDVLFVAGNVSRLASIKIRCREIAERLGMHCLFNATDPDQVPGGYKAYLCVKPDFGWQGAEKLGKRATVLWDILDDEPPKQGIAAYISSTQTAAAHFRHLGRVEVIPHYHCNIERIESNHAADAVGYIGSIHWYPDIKNITHRAYFIEDMSREQVAEAYRTLGIALNLRRLSDDFERFIRSPNDVKPVTKMHIILNSGIKLINCLGFGIPSISSVEPAYNEVAPHCTIFTDLSGAAGQVKKLQENPDLFLQMRKQCLELGPAYHVDEIVGKYRMFFDRL